MRRIVSVFLALFPGFGLGFFGLVLVLVALPEVRLELTIKEVATVALFSGLNVLLFCGVTVMSRLYAPANTKSITLWFTGAIIGFASMRYLMPSLDIHSLPDSMILGLLVGEALVGIWIWLFLKQPRDTPSPST